MAESREWNVQMFFPGNKDFPDRWVEISATSWHSKHAASVGREKFLSVEPDEILTRLVSRPKMVVPDWIPELD